MADNPYRLPRTVLPSAYQIDVAPELTDETFEGSVRIHANATETVRSIQLHAAGLTVSQVRALDANNAIINATLTELEDERIELHLESALHAGPCVIEMTFAGSLSENLFGFYRSTFRDENDTEQRIATTQFEPTYARNAFPCFDEPDMKATFEISLTVDEQLFAVSNAQVVSVTPQGNGKKKVQFAPTMRMSTYLVAFVVGPLVATDPVNVDSTELRVICRPGREKLADFALDCGAAALRYFSEYFGIPYPGDKLDLIGIPDFNFGAMENLGCVTFRETALLVDQDHASRMELERVADVVAHEIGHMWFGDLVTMKWWNGIWLNEAFASFVELLMVDHYRPEWERWTSFGISRAYALATDGLASTRTIEYPVLHPSEAEGMFDVAITYQKGGAVVRMLEQYLEPGEFQRGIAHYLASHQYGNTETTDLWDAIEEATGEPVRALMDSWIFQEGYPVLSVSRGEDGSSLTIRQNRFLYAGARGTDTHWHVPIRLRVCMNGEVENHKLLLTDESITLNFPAKVDWTVVNDGSWGFYRVKYDTDLLRALTSDISRLSSLERFTLLNDSWAAVLSGNAPITDYLELATLFTGETDPDVWAALAGPLDAIRRAASVDDKPLVEAYVKRAVSPALEALGWEAKPGESQRINTTRAVLISALGITANDTGTQDTCVSMLQQEWETPGSINPDLLQTITNVSATVGDRTRFEAYCDRIRSASTPQEEVRYLRALGKFNQRELVLEAVSLTLTDLVRAQDGMFVLANAIANAQWGSHAWEVVKQNWEQLLARLNGSTMARSVEAHADQFCIGLAADVRSFMQEHPIEHSERLIAQTIERLEVNEAFTARIGDAIRSALA